MLPNVNDLITRPCVLVLRHSTGTIDDDGVETTGETEVASVCDLQRHATRRSEEPDLAGETSDTLWLLVLPAGTAIDTGDAVIVDGATYEMVGAPSTVRNPRTGDDSHVEATVRRTAGSETGS